MDSPDILPNCLLICADISKIAFMKKSLKGSYYLLDAKDSTTGIDWLKSSEIEIVILDYKSLDEPLMNLCHHIRKTPGAQSMPILLITNKIQKAFTLDALKAGVSDFIHEPLDETEIQERIAVSLKSKLINKKMSSMTNKIKKTSLIPKNTQVLLHRMLLNDKTMQEISNAKKIATPLSLLMIELDTYHAISKNWGELIAEEVAVSISQFLQQKLRQFDTLISQGGGRFLLLLPKTSQSAAKIIAEDIRSELCRTTIYTQKKEFLVTVSIGLVSFDKKLSDSAQAFEQFDLSLGRVKKALEKAQKKGNKIVLS